MNPRIINLLDFEYPSILHNNESEQLLMKAVNSRKTKLVLKKTKVVLNQHTVPKPVKIQMHSNSNPTVASIFHNDLLFVKALQ